jgi:hypothetical protein
VSNGATRMRVFCCVLGIAAGIAALVHGYMSVRYAQRLTVDDEGWWVQGGAVVALSIIGGIFSFGAGLLAERRTLLGWVGAVAMMAIAVCFVGYTVSNSTGYAGWQVYSKTKPAEARRKQAEDVAAIQNKFATDGRKELRTELFRTYTTAPKKDRDDVQARIEALNEKPLTLQVPDAPDAAVIDPRAEVAKNLLGVDTDKAQALSIAALPILLVVGELLGPFLSALLWPHSDTQNDPRLNATLLQLSATKAKSDVLGDIARGREFCITEYAQKWGVDKGQVSRWFSDWDQAGDIRKAKRGKRIVAVAPTRANGHLRAVS